MPKAQSLPLYLHQMQMKNVLITLFYLLQQRRGWFAVEVNSSNGGLCAFKDDVLGFLHVEVAAAEMLEHMGQHAGTVSMPDDQHVRRRRLRRQVDNVRDLARFGKGPNDANGLAGDR